jgi:hypothetical protein
MNDETNNRLERGRATDVFSPDYDGKDWPNSAE